MKIFPILYKKTNTGAIQYWKIWVIEKLSGCIITTEYGQKDTDKPQTTSDLITSGKNIGKKNATTMLEQAYLDVESKWKKQKKKGYVETLEDASVGKLDALIKGGIEPMLAHSYDKQGSKIKFPCFAQPKLDGHRCIAIINNGKCELWSRTRKKITSVPHISNELSYEFPVDLILDGELYNHNYKDNFEYISHLVRQENPDINHTHVEYHVYDMIPTDNMIFKERYEVLKRNITPNIKYTKLVDTILINKQEEITSYFKKSISLGYEGIILRNSDGLYVNKRSIDLQKVKEFNDAEFEIIGCNEGKGKLKGHVGSFICDDPTSGSTFEVKMSGDTDKLKEYFEQPITWKHKKLTVQFQGRTGAKGVPRFPVGLRFREDV